ncbi:MAG: glutathione S-transferase family protein [Pseudomonadota bacterium]
MATYRQWRALWIMQRVDGVDRQNASALAVRDEGDQMAEYELVYGPMLLGRGEFPRLILEYAAADYVDLARVPEASGGGIDHVMAIREGRQSDWPAYAPPVLRHRGQTLSQTAVICAYLGETFQLDGGAAAKWKTQSAMLSILDCVDEVHDTHHPISVADYYEDQKPEALKRTRAFVDSRLPLRLKYLERLSGYAAGPWLLGAELTYADLGLFQLSEGLTFSFPSAMGVYRDRYPAVMRIARTVSELPTIAAYLQSPRRIPFNEHGVFRQYPELDLMPSGSNSGD